MLVYAWMLSLQSRLKEDRGATAVEYGLLIGLVVVVLAAALLAFGDALTGLFDRVQASLDGVG